MADASRRVHPVGPRRDVRRPAPPCSTRRAALGVDLDTVCGGRGHLRSLPGHARATEPSPSGASPSAADALSAPGPLETDYHGAPAAGPRQPARVRGDDLRRRRDRRAGGQPGAPPGRAQGPRPRPHRGRSVVRPAATSRSRRPCWATPRAPAGCSPSAVGRQHGAASPHVAVPRARLAAPGAGPSRRGGHRGRRARRQPTAPTRIVAVWPATSTRRTASPSTSARPRSPGICCDLSTGEIVASAGRMNPQIRFGEDLMSRVSYVMMNPGGDRELTACRAGRARRTRSTTCCDARDLDARPGAGDRAGRQPDHAPRPARHRPDARSAAAPFTLATDEAVDRPGRRARARPPARVVLRRAVHRRPRRRRHRGGDPRRGPAPLPDHAAARRRRHQRRDRARRPTPAVRGVEPDRAGVRRRPDQLRAAGHRGAIEKVRIDPVTLEPRVRVIGCAAVVRRTRLRRGASPTHRDQRGVRLGHHRRDRRDVPRRHHRPRRRDPWRAGRTLAPRRRRRPHVLVRAPRRPASTGSASPRTTCGPSSSPRPALRAGHRSARSNTPGSPVVADIRLAGAFGAHIDPVRALVLGLVPDCPLDGVRSVGNAAGVGAVQALLSRAAARRDGVTRFARSPRSRRRPSPVPGAVRRGDGVSPRHCADPSPRDGRRTPRSRRPIPLAASPPPDRATPSEPTAATPPTITALPTITSRRMTS